MPYVNGDGTLHVVLPSADQQDRPTFRIPAIVELCGAALGAVLAFTGLPRLAVLVLAAAMVPYGIAVLAHRGRLLRGLHGGDEGALPAGVVAQLLGPVIAIALAAIGSTAWAVAVLAGATMLAATAQALISPQRKLAAGAAVGALLLASIAFALGIVGLVGARGAVIASSLVAASAAVATGAESSRVPVP